MNARTLFTLSTLAAVSTGPLAACTETHATQPPIATTVAPSVVTPAHDDVLEHALASIAAGYDGTAAVSVLNLSDGTRASLHGDVRLPLMSVFKLPLAIVALSMVEDGTLKLEQEYPIAESELRPGVSPIAEAWKEGKHSVTLETMLVRTLQDSDNTAGDKLVTIEGGGPAITARLRKLGIPGIDIAEQEIEIFARTDCPGAAPPAGGWTFPAIDACPKPTPAMHLAAGEHEITHSPNAASTDALVGMLAAIEHDALPRSGGWLHDTLAGTKTGVKRLKALLPPGTRIEHKTGTGGETEGLNLATNDVGVITLPDGKRVAIAVLTAGSRQPIEVREALIARFAKATWDRLVH